MEENKIIDFPVSTVLSFFHPSSLNSIVSDFQATVDG